MAPRRLSSRPRSTRPKRPYDRMVRAGGWELTSGGTTGVGYTYTAVLPQTAFNFRLDITDTIANESVAYALVYIPEGYDANQIVYPAFNTNMYNPTTNVIISGVLAATDRMGDDDEKFQRIGRKMQTGDRIALLVYSTQPAQGSFELNFTIVT